MLQIIIIILQKITTVLESSDLWCYKPQMDVTYVSVPVRRFHQLLINANTGW